MVTIFRTWRPFFFMLVLFSISWATLAVKAQDTLEETFEFESGTTIDYPAGWSAVLENQLLIITDDSSQSQVIVIDYPFIPILFQNNTDPTPTEAVAGVAEQVLGESINEEEIYTFDIDEREITIYEIDLALSGAVAAVPFDNGVYGMLVTIDVPVDLQDAFIASFNSTGEVGTDVAIPSNTDTAAAITPTAYIFQATARFITPVGWSITPRLRDEIEYTTLTAPDDADATVVLIDLSEAVTNGTALSAVVDSAGFDWEDALGVTIDLDSETAFDLADREAIQYEIEADGTDGTLVILRFSSNAIGAAVVYGTDVEDYATDVAQLIGSFRNLGALLDFFS